MNLLIFYVSLHLDFVLTFKWQLTEKATVDRDAQSPDIHRFRLISLVAEAFWWHKRHCASFICHSEMLINDFNNRSEIRDLRSIFVVGVCAIFSSGEQNIIGLNIPVRHFDHGV